MNSFNSLPPEEARQDDVILAVLQLSRALRRCPPENKRSPFPPAVIRLLKCIEQNSGVSSRELCELLDLRPSSLSELLARSETAGLLTRTPDETDRRIQHVTLTERGHEIISLMEEARQADYQRKTSCFTAAEAHQFCELSRRLSSHLESIAPEQPAPENRRHPRHPPFDPPENGHPVPFSAPEKVDPAFVPDPGAEEENPEMKQVPSPKHRKMFPEGARFRS